MYTNILKDKFATAPRSHFEQCYTSCSVIKKSVHKKLMSRQLNILYSGDFGTYVLYCDNPNVTTASFLVLLLPWGGLYAHYL